MGMMLMYETRMDETAQQAMLKAEKQHCPLDDIDLPQGNQSSTSGDSYRLSPVARVELAEN